MAAYPQGDSPVFQLLDDYFVPFEDGLDGTEEMLTLYPDQGGSSPKRYTDLTQAHQPQYPVGPVQPPMHAQSSPMHIQQAQQPMRQLSPLMTQVQPQQYGGSPLHQYSGSPWGSMDSGMGEFSFDTNSMTTTFTSATPPPPLHQQQQPQPQQPQMGDPNGMQQLSSPMGFGSSSAESTMTWSDTHLTHWSPRQVMDWARYVISHSAVPGAQGYCVEMFGTLRGVDLSNMTRAQFMEVSPAHGSLLYNQFQLMRGTSDFVGPQLGEGESFVRSAQVNAPFAASMANTGATVAAPNQFYKMMDAYDFDTGCQFQDLPTNLGVAERACDTPSCSDVDSTPPTSPSSGFSASYPYHQVMPNSQLLRRARPSRASGSPGSKGNHLWEFIISLLKNKDHNPKLIKWEDQKEGVFRFVQSEQVAKMWGDRKNNPNMTYEKLSRAMRFCRQSEYFSVVPKTGKYPKKLVFKFGRKATGWSNI